MMGEIIKEHEAPLIIEVPATKLSDVKAMPQQKGAVVVDVGTAYNGTHVALMPFIEITPNCEEYRRLLDLIAALLERNKKWRTTKLITKRKKDGTLRLAFLTSCVWDK